MQEAVRLCTRGTLDLLTTRHIIGAEANRSLDYIVTQQGVRLLSTRLLRLRAVCATFADSSLPGFRRGP